MIEENILTNIQRPPTLTEIAYDRIKRSIISGQISFGENYSELSLAKELGISKTPVREALQELKHRGFIEILPKKGFHLKEMDPKQIRDLFEFRWALERAVIINCTPKIEACHIEKLNHFNERLLENADLFYLYEVDVEFHRYLAGLTTNDQIIQALDGVTDLFLWICVQSFTPEGYMEKTREEHRRVIAALEKQDEAGALTAMETHLREGLDAILAERQQ